MYFVVKIAPYIQRVKVLADTLRFQLFSRAHRQVTVAPTLRLDDEVESGFSIVILDVRPVGVVTSKWRVDREARGSLA